MAYTPGVARVSRAIADNPAKVWALTIKQNTVAVVTDGTAVLGLGDIGPEGALPVMEGKAVLFKEFGDIDAWPVCLATKDVDEIVRTVAAIAPVFGGINLEDISAPRCFEVERRLRELLDIPVFHDDQHGTAIVTLAAFINALQVVGKRPGGPRRRDQASARAEPPSRRPSSRPGSATSSAATGRAPSTAAAGARPRQSEYASLTNPHNFAGSADEALEGADVYIGLSAPGAVSVEAVRRMADKAIVFAMANPTPEVMPEEIDDVAAVVATGRSDYPNQINNVLAFPGVFRGRSTSGHARSRRRWSLRPPRRWLSSRTTSCPPTTSCRASSTGGSRRRSRRRSPRRRSTPASRGARSKARAGDLAESRRSPACSLGSQPPGLEAGPDLDDSRAQVPGGSAELSSGLAEDVAQQAHAGDGAGRVELELLVVELGGKRLDLLRRREDARSYKSPGRWRVAQRRCERLTSLHRGLPGCPGQDLRNGVRVALPRQPLDRSLPPQRRHPPGLRRRDPRGRAAPRAPGAPRPR